MKKNFNDKQKKSYHELIEEQDSTKEVFKRSQLPRKKPVVIVEEVEKPKYNARGNDTARKPYQRKEFDQDERTFKSNTRSTSEYKKPYTPRTTQDASGEKKVYTPRPNSSSEYKKPYTPRTGSNQNNPSTPYVKKEYKGSK